MQKARRTFTAKHGDVGHADEAGGDAVEGEDGAGDQQDAKGGVDEGEVVLAGIGGVLRESGGGADGG